MKKQIQLLIIEASADSASAASFQFKLQSFPNVVFTVQSLSEAMTAGVSAKPDLVLLHGTLTSIGQLHRFIQLHPALPHTGIVLVNKEQTADLCIMALEAGADDSITEDDLTELYLHKAVWLSRHRSRTEKELNQNREQLLACLQNTPNVAVQWYNAQGEVVFWNNASEYLYGWTREEAMGQTIDTLIVVPENRVYWLQRMAQLQTGLVEVITEEWAFTRRNGDNRYCLSTLFPISSLESGPLFVCMDVDITERQQMEQALRQSEEKYFTLFNRASDAIFINDLEGRYYDMNEKACVLTGYSKTELLQRRVTDLYSAEELQMRPIMWAELRRGERTCIERNLVRANGITVPIEVTAQLISPNRVMAIVRDISERKKAELALRQSEEKYRSLIDQQADAIAIFDKDEKILDVNGSTSGLLGYSKEELRRLKLSDVFLREEMMVNPVDFSFLSTGHSKIRQRRMRRKDGTIVETEVHTKRLLNGLFLASVRDLTQRIDVQNRLKKEIELSESIINSLPGLFYLFTQEGKYLRWNRQQEMISGYSDAEIADMKPLDFIADADKEIVQNAIIETFQVGYAVVEANLLTKAGKTIPYYFTGIKVQYGGTECLLGTGIDLSALKNLEKELSEQKIAEQKRLMQAMIEAEEKERHKLGLELHDNVNQILSVVRMYLSILNSDDKMEEITLPKAIDLLNSAITEIRHLSHSLAVSYKFEMGLAGTLEDMVEKIQAARGVVINLSVPPQLDELTSVRQKLAIYRMVQEQLNNVIKHAKATTVEISIVLTNDELRLTIADDGKGFNPAKAKKGLGLSNIANRAEALAGRSFVFSKPGKGTRLEVIMPLPEEM